MAEAIKLIFQALEEASIQLDDSQKAAVDDALKELPLALSDKTLKDGQVAVNETFYNSQRDDLKKWKGRARDSEQKLKDLEDSLAAGESTNLRVISELKDKIKQLEPVNSRLMADAKTRWEKAAATIPEKLQGKFKKVDPDKGEDASLSDEDILANLARYDEYLDIGAIDPDHEPDEEDIAPDPEKTPELGKHGNRDKQKDKSFDHLPVQERMKKGYKPMK